MPSYLTPFLSLGSFIYSVGLQLDKTWKSSRRQPLKRPVISIGNLTVGGTGKTPVLLRLVKDLTEQGVRPAVLSRGYRGFGKLSEPVVISPEKSIRDDRPLSDEIRLMVSHCPHVTIGAGADRVRMADEILSRSAVDVFILDDGFQHWRVARDLDIVCVDGTDPWGGERLLPRGRLREPVEALARAQVVLLTRTEWLAPAELEQLKTKTQSLAPQAQVLATEFRSRLWSWNQKVDLPFSSLAGKKTAALSAIGNPFAFEQALKKQGAEVVPFRFRDHYEYREADLNRVERFCKEERALLVTTEKDFVKLSRLSWGRSETPPLEAAVLKIDLQFQSGDEERWGRILHRFAAPSISGFHRETI